VKYYFILPAVVLLGGLIMSQRWKIGAAALAVIGLAIYFGGGFFETVWSMDDDVWLSEYLGIFLAGSAVGILYAAIVRQGWQLERYRTWFDGIGIVCLLAAVLLIPSVFSAIFPTTEEINKVPGDIGILSALWSVFLLSVLLGRGWLSSALSFAPLRWLGLISYSVYLWHPFVLDHAEELALPTGLRWLVFLGGTAAISTATYWVIERPLASIRLPSRTRPSVVYEQTMSQPVA